MVSTWDDAGAPSCGTSQRVLIDGDTVTADCDLQLSGSGYVLIRNEGYLKIKGDLDLSGNADLEVGDDAGMEVQGNMTVSGQGDLTLDGEVEATGDLELNGSNAVADGSGDLTLGGTGCLNFTDSGSCNEGVSLPVSLTEFEVEDVKEGIRLKWTTATERRNDHFIVQRSKDGLGYEGLGRIQGHGTSSQEHSYRYLDRSPPSGDLYYRLVQEDLDGESQVYGPKAISSASLGSEEECRMKIVPNPCRGDCRIEFSEVCKDDIRNETLRIQLFDIAGNKVYSELEKGDGFSSEFMLDTEKQLSPGVYVVRAISHKQMVASEKMKKK